MEREKKVSSTKRGFKYKNQAELFDARMKNNTMVSEKSECVGNLEIEAVVEMYFSDMSMLKDKTLDNKRAIIERHILNVDNKKGIASFRGKRLKDIDAQAIIEWQNKKRIEKMDNGERYSECYLRIMRKRLQ